MNKFFSHPIFYGVLSGSVYVGMEYLFELKSEGPYPLKKALLSFVVMGGPFYSARLLQPVSKAKEGRKRAEQRSKISYPRILVSGPHQSTSSSHMKNSCSSCVCSLTQARASSLIGWEV